MGGVGESCLYLGRRLAFHGEKEGKKGGKGEREVVEFFSTNPLVISGNTDEGRKRKGGRNKLAVRSRLARGTEAMCEEGGGRGGGKFLILE